MLRNRNAWRIALLLELGGVVLSLLVADSSIDASDKKAEKKNDPPPLLKKSDDLAASDPMDSRLTKSPCKTYAVALTEGKTYQIDLSSKFFDSFLRLEDAKGKQVAFNDDADASTFDARIVYKATQTGEYRIIAASADGKLGRFDLSVVEAGKKAALLTGSRFRAKAIDLSLKDGKASYRGKLDEKDAAALNRYYKVFVLSLEKNKTYRFESKPDDPKVLTVNLYLEDADGALLDSSGFSKDGVTARIVHKTASAGSYRITVTTKPAQQVGRFSLEIVPE
jgi:Bacterial pre-peptidase C-terminal domain